MKTFPQLAAIAYAAYCKQAGGKTFDDKPLPAYEDLGSDRRTCWVEAVRQVAAEIAAIH